MEPHISIIIPTYNESKTIFETVQTISKVLSRENISTSEYEILIVDDNSPDGTGNIIQELSTSLPVHLITRTSDPGLSQSVIEGFTKARGDVIVVTDSDGSHDISLIPQMYQRIKDGSDIVVGSRYCKDGGIKDWPIKRRIISWGATFLSRVLFPYVSDPVSGFFAVKKDLVSHAPLKSCGYKILLEILGKSYWHTISEIPYIFQNRKQGESKLRTNTMVEFVQQLWYISRFQGRAQKEITKIKKFAAVGISGVFVNMIALAALKELFGAPLIMASFISIELAIISNFLLNDSWTFKASNNTKNWTSRLISFNGVSIGGMVINIGVLGILASLGIYYLIGNLAGILMAFSWNFFANRKITWAETK